MDNKIQSIDPRTPISPFIWWKNIDYSALNCSSHFHESTSVQFSCLVLPTSLWPHGLQPTRLLCPWDFPGKSTGVGCHCLLHDGLESGWTPGFGDGQQGMACSDSWGHKESDTTEQLNWTTQKGSPWRIYPSPCSLWEAATTSLPITPMTVLRIFPAPVHKDQLIFIITRPWVPVHSSQPYACLRYRGVKTEKSSIFTFSLLQICTSFPLHSVCGHTVMREWMKSSQGW